VSWWPGPRRGLGESYLSPEREWSADAWRWIVTRALGHKVEQPAWWDDLALRQDKMVNPILARAAATSGVAARPFGFRLAATAWGGGSSPVAPYNRDPASWADLDWRDRRTGKALALGIESDEETALPGGLPGERLHVTLITLGRVVRRIAGQDVPTFDDPVTGRPANHRTRGLLRRRSTVAEHLVLTGADRTPFTRYGEDSDQRYPSCRRCGCPLDGQASQQFCSDACREAGKRHRTKEAEKQAEAAKQEHRIAVRATRVCHNAPDCAGSWLLNGRQREWCSKRCARAGEREAARLARLAAIGGRPCPAESCRNELFGGAVCTYHERKA
jgi:hypothetical protein